MENLADLPLDVLLSAYLDGELDEAAAGEIEARLATDTETRALLDRLKAGSAHGDQLFDALLREPAPLHLARAIKDAADRGETSQPSAPLMARAGRGWFFGQVPQAIAASALLLLGGGYAGYTVGRQYEPQRQVAAEQPSEANSPTTLSVGGQTRSFTVGASGSAPSGRLVSARDVLAVHAVYAAQESRAAEIPAAELVVLTDWLRDSARVAFEVPDLTADGLTFEGGRLVVISGKPAAALYYRDAGGERVGVYFSEGKTDPLRLTEGDVTLLAGMRNGLSWFVAAPSSLAETDRLAEHVDAAVR
ncbi:anti-sigma factor [Rhizobium sp. G21]|uniref:anti-sigma factor family protein n=1 Tax=Rhizobium sp. G21 TaxID=2758439 RepID=UPI0016009DA8|nr:anti-sigma factor [Rhizobium sp. G21]MBB1250416.1 anti-sigma factor [Rhizobium sp. G21]